MMKVLRSINDLASLPFKRIAVFSGVFDPMHHGHLGIISAGQELVDAILIIPCVRHPRKRPTPLKHRVEIIRRFVPDVYHKTVFIALPGQAFSFMENGCIFFNSKLYKTWRKKKTLSVLVGQDALYAEYPHHLEELNHFIMPRAGTTRTPETVLSGSWIILDTPIHTISSTEIRQRLKHGENVFEPAVMQYIKEFGLYRHRESYIGEKTVQDIF